MIHAVTSVEEMLVLAGQIANSVQNGEVIALDGPLGAGKTHFAKGFAAALGYSGPVTSPTFSLVQEYFGGKWPVYHLDFYRLETAEEALDAGLQEYLPGEGVTLVEWASRFPDLLPPEARHIQIRVKTPTEREVEIEDVVH